MKNQIIDADWTPSQRAAASYSRRVRWKREAVKMARVQRLFVGSMVFLVAVMAVALIIK
jgi:hypothetical protein